MTDPLHMYTIYRHPTDFPGKFVVRECTVTSTGLQNALAPLAVVDSLKEARRRLHAQTPGLSCLGRNPQDDPVIVEVWV